MLFQKKKHETVDEARPAVQEAEEQKAPVEPPKSLETRRARERETLELLRDLIGSANSLPHLKEAIEQRLAESEQE